MQKWDHKYEGVSCSRVFNSLQPHTYLHTHTHTHTQLHDTAKEKQLPPNRTFSIKETRIPLTFKKRKKGS